MQNVSFRIILFPFICSRTPPLGGFSTRCFSKNVLPPPQIAFRRLNRCPSLSKFPKRKYLPFSSHPSPFVILCFAVLLRRCFAPLRPFSWLVRLPWRQARFAPSYKYSRLFRSLSPQVPLSLCLTSFDFQLSRRNHKHFVFQRFQTLGINFANFPVFGVY